LIVLSGNEGLEQALSMIRKHGAKLVSVTPQKGSLEELFITDLKMSDSGTGAP
jgi:hypothetical protein